MITKEEVGALLLFVSTFDNRTIGRADVEAWHAIASEGRWPSFDVARRAVVKHHNARPDDRIRPGHVSVIVREARQTAAQTFPGAVAPDELRDPAERADWTEARRLEWVQQWLARWAAGDDSPGFRMRQVAIAAVDA